MAQVDFTAGEFVAWVRNYRPFADPYPVYEQMQEAETHREVMRALDAVSDMTHLHGIEGIAVPEGAVNPDQAVSYVNTGDTYDQTVLYDEGTSTFMLMSWGDWFERAERAVEQLDANDEDVCGSCGRVFPMDEMVLEVRDSGHHEATCRECERKKRPPPTWTPRVDQPLVTMIRSVEGIPIAVHLYAREYSTQDLKTGEVRHEPALAFSAVVSRGPPYDEQFVAAKAQGAYGKILPVHFPWSALVAQFQQHSTLFFHCAVGFEIEREMFSRLRVAMDAFFETGMQYQPLPYMLETPPILFTCAEVNEIQWLTDGRNRDGIQAFVRREEEVGSTIQESDLLVWSAGEAEVAELIKDGFIRWGNDHTVRDWLRERGICR